MSKEIYEKELKKAIKKQEIVVENGQTYIRPKAAVEIDQAKCPTGKHKHLPEVSSCLIVWSTVLCLYAFLCMGKNFPSSHIDHYL